MYHCVYTLKKLNQADIIKKIAQGLGVEACKVEHFDIKACSKKDIVIFIGLIHGMGQLYRSLVERKQTFWYCDHAYFLSGYETGWHRITKNALVQNRIIDYDIDRYHRYFSSIKLDSWRGFKGNHILSSPPSDSVEFVVPGLREWYRQTIKTVSKKLKLPVVERIKNPVISLDSTGNIINKMIVLNEHDIEQDLNLAACVITPVSNLAVKATLKGIPVIVPPQSMCAPVVADVNRLDYEPNRTPWLYSLCSSQFHPDEMTAGSIVDLVNRQ
jgi:hypothetical protein